ncbi:VOC family protein [Oceanicoccus sagamiensis]|uniref:Glyoxalase/fosfomycin resistance/dioxygenase domain-containing protein n=1 Tax=Oceanicoccus sagamiensis TaxID=716816 RepID=A0A1X9NIN0_9GAMM|nr:VOC family protein [Oceanicoccus sagamiensis]ARN73843.1 hypothetical protein BST96_06775 [Oceanicoccus sagamiensis]
MLSHVTLGVNNIEESTKFYDAVMETIGYQRGSCGESWVGYGDISGKCIDTLWLLTPANGEAATSGNGTNVGLVAPTRESVDKFYNTALANGGVDEGAPGIRAVNHPNFYAAYVRDLDGNKLLAVCHEAE